MKTRWLKLLWIKTCLLISLFPGKITIIDIETNILYIAAYKLFPAWN